MAVCQPDVGDCIHMFGDDGGDSCQGQLEAAGKHVEQRTFVEPVKAAPPVVQPAVLHDSSRMPIDLAPFFMKHSDGGLSARPIGASQKRIPRPWWHGGGAM